MRQDPCYVRGVCHVSSREFASDLLSVQPLDAAWVLPFEDYSPARAFPSYKGQRNFTGLFWCATNSRLVGYESLLERDHLMCLDFSPAVVGIASQPFRLDFDLAGGRRRHVPISSYGWVTVPASSWMSARITASAGMTAKFFQQRNPPAPRLAGITGASAFSPGLCLPICAGLPDTDIRGAWFRPREQAVRECLQDGSDSIFGLAAAVGNRVAVLPTLFHLLWIGTLTADLRSRPLGQDSEVSLKALP